MATPMQRSLRRKLAYGGVMVFLLVLASLLVLGLVVFSLFGSAP